jgi:hypothetical protein
MMIVMAPNASEEQIASVIERVTSNGYQPHRSDGAERTVIGVIGAVDRGHDPRTFEVLDGVASVVPLSSPFKLASRELQQQDTVIDLGRGIGVGGSNVVLMAGPCTTESAEQIHALVEPVDPNVPANRQGCPFASLWSRPADGGSELAVTRDAGARRMALYVRRLSLLLGIATVVWMALRSSNGYLRALLLGIVACVVLVVSVEMLAHSLARLAAGLPRQPDP